MSGSRALVLGCGYVGLRLARALAGRGTSVVGTTRSAERMDEIAAAGARPAIADVLDPATLLPLAEWHPHVVFDLVRPQPTGEDSYTVEGTRNAVRAFAATLPDALVYVSSTSVYGRREGEWTDETTPPLPSSPIGEARVEAERTYLEAWRDSGLPVRICRVPGLYGPGRTLRERLERGAYRRLDDDDHWVSRIHVDDLVMGLIAAWERGRPGETYLLCDDEPVTGAEYAELTADLLGLPLPPAVLREDIRHDLSGSAFERRVGARRCSNRRMREELGVIPIYPSVREGVPAALREEGVL
ncbi:MAG TPA: SDR family oxidoreductase [Longimicrobiaceae bacterium]|nr:SDR family oxidoreductase [Longimicrobiaceae bacterium]